MLASPVNRVPLDSRPPATHYRFLIKIEAATGGKIKVVDFSCCFRKAE
jgi:hypothetical protein